MKLNELKAPKGAVKKKKRVGRGDGSGHGGTSCRGHKGQKARSGGSIKPGFEGGQMPLTRRLPKRGFYNRFRKNIVIVNIDALQGFPEGTVVDTTALMEAGIIKQRGDGVKVLGNGKIDYPLILKVDHISDGARQKIEASGGKVEVI